ncbi:MAG: fibronectin type III domain-containing protein, partial [Candidatus Pacebacteria bacterium]|nr:fibronectin type III domain-containing protein [Candidatus Paceibacterota bacterium]
MSNNNTSYNYYRMSISSSVGNSNITSVGSIHLFGTEVLSTSTASTTHRFSNLIPSTDYTVSVQAYNSNAVSNISTTSLSTLATSIIATTITGFQYSSSSVAYGDISPSLTQGVTNSDG